MPTGKDYTSIFPYLHFNQPYNYSYYTYLSVVVKYQKGGCIMHGATGLAWNTNLMIPLETAAFS